MYTLTCMPYTDVSNNAKWNDSDFPAGRPNPVYAELAAALKTDGLTLSFTSPLAKITPLVGPGRPPHRWHGPNRWPMPWSKPERVLNCPSAAPAMPISPPPCPRMNTGSLSPGDYPLSTAGVGFRSGKQSVRYRENQRGAGPPTAGVPEPADFVDAPDRPHRA